MKKLFSLISATLCAAMLLMPVSAAKAPDAATLYKRVSEKMNAATSVEMQLKMKIVMDSDDESTEVYSAATAKQLKLADGTYQMEQHLTTISDSVDTMDSSIYYKNGYTYTRMGDTKFKAKSTIDEALANAGDMGMDLALDSLQDGTVEVLPEGGYKLRFKIAGSELKSMANALDSSAFDALDELGMKLSVGTVTYVMTLSPDAQLESASFAYSMSMKSDDMSIKTKNYINIDIVSVNKPMTIIFPNDLNTYTES